MTTPLPKSWKETLKALTDNGLIEEALSKAKEWGLKVEWHNGKLIDMTDSTESWLNKFITIDGQTIAMLDNVRKLSKVNDEVLIYGETGTGKELLAKALHGDRNGKFIAVNCAGLPEQLVESLLFGHARGSFTGAMDTRPGYMQLAKDGTLFLDEVGELPLQAQAKFLRAIQEKKIMKVGGDKEEDINCRVVCATHRDLWSMVQKELFRLDLYGRLTTFIIAIKPLWRRQCDVIPILKSMDADDILINCIREHDIIKENNLVNIQKLIALNVRSLQQIYRRYTVLGELP